MSESVCHFNRKEVADQLPKQVIPGLKALSQASEELFNIGLAMG
jgi:hypothetical protein